jgi:hypothetical protein
MGIKTHRQEPGVVVELIDEQVVLFAGCLHGLGQRLHGAHEKFIRKAAIRETRRWNDEKRGVRLDGVLHLG